MRYNIIDDAMPSDFHDKIWSTMSSHVFPWFYGNTTNYQQNGDEEFIKQDDDLDDYHFIHHFYDNDAPCSIYYKDFIAPILSGLDAITPLRVKANLHPRTTSLFQNHWHKDYPVDHRGAVYYLNSNDGFTVFEDGTKVESVANRLLIFDSYELHRSTTCTNAKGRFNINFNFF